MAENVAAGVMAAARSGGRRRRAAEEHRGWRKLEPCRGGMAAFGWQNGIEGSGA